MTLQILPCDISVSEEMRLKSIKHGVCPSNTWAKGVTHLQGKKPDEAKQDKPNPPSPASVATCLL